MELLQIVWDHYEYMDADYIMRDRKAELLLEQAQKNKMMFRLMGEKLRHRLENQFSYYLLDERYTLVLDGPGQEKLRRWSDHYEKERQAQIQRIKKEK